MSVKQKISALLAQLNKGVYEKEEALRLALLSAIAGESIFLLGPPGVAKSLVARRLKFAFKENGAFEYLMNRFSTPDEIFGPVAISKLKNEDKYERVVKNYLPTATVVFLDEIWKAGPSIQNALLTVLNERKYRNGEQEIDVPMKALISASNELPMKDSGLEALWDRFLVRLEVLGIQSQQAFNEMITKPLNPYENTVKDELKISDAEYKQWGNEIEQIELPENVLNVIHVIRGYLDRHNQKEENKDNRIYISDRRWKKIVRLLRTAAFLNDRKEVDLMDCFLIIPCLWDETKQIKTAEQFVKDAVEKHGYKLDINLNDLKEEIKDFEAEVSEETNYLKPILRERLKPYNKEYYKIVDYNNYFIKISDFSSLKVNEAENIRLYSKQGRNDFYHQTNRSCRKGNKKFSIAISDGHSYNSSQYQLETEEYEDQIPATKKPHHATKKHWDKEVAKFLTITTNLKSKIEHYRKNDLNQLGKNLFVNPALVDLVVSNLNDTQKQIEKLEVKIREVQYYYGNLEDKIEKELLQLTNGKENE